MRHSSFILVSLSVALTLVGCSSGPINYCGRGCSPKGVQRGTNGSVDAEGGPLVASCPVGFTCSAVSSTCVANDGHCATTGGSGTTGSPPADGGNGASSGSSGGTSGGTTG